MAMKKNQNSITPQDLSAAVCENNRASLTPAALKQAILDHLLYSLGQPQQLVARHACYKALALSVRDRLQHRWINTALSYMDSAGAKQDVKMVCYLSAEFLMGPQLGSSLVNLGIEKEVRQALTELGLNLEELLAQEEEPGLGNGGLGRLAACYIDSLATLECPAIGYGVRYEFGIFDQEIRDGWQVEITDKWLLNGNPWEIERPDVTYYVNFGGFTESYHDEQGSFRMRWVPHRVVKGIAYDTPIPGYRVNTCNTLRLWSAQACESFDFQAFNTGDYYEAVGDKVISETLTKVLYPNDEPEVGKKLRLAQQFFFVSCSLQDMLRIFTLTGEPLASLPKRFAAQLNDTHPSIAVAELMRLLVDEHKLAWDPAWDITCQTFAYTNHTLLPEALETWSLPLFQELLPRHLEIIYEINARFLDLVRSRYPGDSQRVARLSLIDEAGAKRVRMAHLACVGSHAVNGVAALHSELLKTSVLKDFYELWPERFNNKTNGVTPRRFMVLANPQLSGLITRAIGGEWVTRTEELRRLEPLAADAGFRREWRAVKQANKERLAAFIHRQTGITLEPTWLFDVQVKRIHEYKRQHLNALHIISLYCRLKAEPAFRMPPRAFIFGGKAAPGYFMAKRMIKLINAVAEVVNNDPDVNRFLRVAFVPNFNVQNGEIIYPAADLSEQISTAGKEASGTGNMKFTLNGALTIGTLDGANVEIREEVGEENFFLFGLTAEEVFRLQHEGYRPASFIEANPQLAEAMHLLATGHFSHGDQEIFRPLVDNLRYHDHFLVLADYAAYAACQNRVSAAWEDQESWTVMSILNTARAGKFSSDRAIRQYCEEIWNVRPIPVSMSR
ncbi:MAG: glycogen/starch/alpha-glucan phosphorylase [Desulfurivibrio sp.]|nr:MAG: glycogen/starch/alpha-glucan phosphorylase [Desulfurivibrio sp.]